MQFSMLIAPIILPVIFWAGYHYHKDRHLPEPMGHLAFAFLLGIGSYWLGRGLYMGLDLFDSAKMLLCSRTQIAWGY